jgi:hypothetical protein
MNPPVLSVVRGQPTDSELAALIGALTAFASATSSATQTPVTVSTWTDRSRRLTGRITPGPTAWRHSLRGQLP